MPNTRRSFRRTTPHRPTSWEGVNVEMTVTTGASFAVTAISEAILEGNAPGTIVRVRGRLGFQASAAAADQARSVITVGLILVTDAAFAQGVASMPTPGTDVGSDWLLHRSVPIGVFDSTFNTGLVQGPLSAQAIEFDGKAMRKYDRNQVLALIVQNTVAFSTMTVQVFGAFRFLIKH